MKVCRLYSAYLIDTCPSLVPTSAHITPPIIQKPHIASVKYDNFSSDTDNCHISLTGTARYLYGRMPKKYEVD